MGWDQKNGLDKVDTLRVLAKFRKLADDPQLPLLGEVSESKLFGEFHIEQTLNKPISYVSYRIIVFSDWHFIHFWLSLKVTEMRSWCASSGEGVENQLWLLTSPEEILHFRQLVQ